MVVFFGLGKTSARMDSDLCRCSLLSAILSLFVAPENIKSRSLPFQLFRFVPSQHFKEQPEKNKRTAQPCEASSPMCDAMFGQKH